MTPSEIARLIDISAVRAESTDTDVREIAAAARRYGFICAFAMPSMTKLLRDELAGSGVMLGGVVGFPSGSETTECKTAQARAMLALGCHEVDMVMNIGYLKSGMYDAVAADIRAVLDAVAPTPLKVIIEVPLLTDDEIVKASEIVGASGATFVKSGTGWAGATTPHHVALMKQGAAGRVQIKVAGGVRDLATLLEMHAMGVTRFGIGYRAALGIMGEAENGK